MIKTSNYLNSSCRMVTKHLDKRIVCDVKHKSEPEEDDQEEKKGLGLELEQDDIDEEHKVRVSNQILKVAEKEAGRKTNKTQGGAPPSGTAPENSKLLGSQENPPDGEQAGQQREA